MYLFHLDLFSSVLAMKIIDAIKIEFLLFFWDILIYCISNVAGRNDFMVVG